MAVGGVMLASGAVLWRLEMQGIAERSRAAVAALRKEGAAAMQAPAAAATEPQPNFAAALAVSPTLAPIAQDLKYFCAELGVDLVTIDTTTREATSRTLQRNEATVVLRGPYGALKSVVAQLLSRHRDVMIPRVALRRLPGTGDVIEAQVALTQLGRAAMAEVVSR